MGTSLHIAYVSVGSALVRLLSRWLTQPHATLFSPHCAESFRGWFGVWHNQSGGEARETHWFTAARAADVDSRPPRYNTWDLDLRLQCQEQTYEFPGVCIHTSWFKRHFHRICVSKVQVHSSCLTRSSCFDAVAKSVIGAKVAFLFESRWIHCCVLLCIVVPDTLFCYTAVVCDINFFNNDITSTQWNLNVMRHL